MDEISSAFLLYFRRVLASKRYRGLKDYQQGWWWNLLLHMASDGGSLALDRADLWALAGARDRGFWESQKAAVLAAFERREVSAGRVEIYSERLTHSLQVTQKLAVAAKSTAVHRPNEHIYKGGRFVVPSVEEVKKHLEERKSPIDAETFWNFYQSKGWKIGKSPMKNWHSAIVTWEKKYYSEHPDEELCRDPEHFGLCVTFANRGRCSVCFRYKAER